MSVDLRTCKPGDKLEMRNGEVAEYCDSNGSRPYMHRIKMPSGKGALFTDNGQLYSYRTSSADIVKVIPMLTDSTIPPRGAKDFTQYAISVMMAYDRGEAVECAHKGRSNFDPMTFPAWNWDGCDYRIKPKPTVIPWTRSSCPVGNTIIKNGNRYLILSAGDDSASLPAYGIMSYKWIMDNFTMDDGSPCGTVQQ